MKKLPKIGGILFIIGVVVFLIGFAFAGFDFSKISPQSAYKEKNYTYSGDINSITIDDSNRNVFVQKSNDDKIHINYYENNLNTYKIQEGKNLVVTKEYKNYARAWYKSMFNFQFGKEKFTTVYIPSSFKGNLDIKTSNATIAVGDIEVNNIVCKTNNAHVGINKIKANKIDVNTSNNTITIGYLDCDTNIVAKTSNAGIEYDNVKATNIDNTTTNGRITLNNTLSKENIYSTTTNADIIVDNLNGGKEINLKSTNGHINGFIAGKISDFTIYSKTTNGGNSLPENLVSGSKILKVNTTNAIIDIKFLEK